MANLNDRQIAFINRTRAFAAHVADLYGEAYELKQSFDEEFESPQDNSIDPTDGKADNLEEMYNFDYNDAKAALDQAVENFINYWTGAAVGTREYGKDLRRIA